MDTHVAEQSRRLAELRGKHEELHSGVHELVDVAMSATDGVRESITRVKDSFGRIDHRVSTTSTAVSHLQERSDTLAKGIQSLTPQFTEVGIRLNSSDASAKAIHESLRQLNAVLLKTNNNIVGHLEPGLEAQKNELLKLNASYKHSLSNVMKKLEQVASATDMLQCRVDKQFEALSEITTSVAQLNKMSESLEPFLQQHHKELQQIAKLAATSTSVSEKLEPALESTCDEISKLKTLQQEMMLSVVATKRHIAECLEPGLKAQNEELLKLSTSHKDSSNSHGRRLDQVAAVVDKLQCRVNQHTLDSHQKEICELKALQQHQESLQVQKEELSKLISSHQECLKVQNEEMLKVQNEELSKIRASHQERFSSVILKLDEVVGTAKVLKCRADQHADGLKEVTSGLAETKNKMSGSVEPALEKHREETRQHMRTVNQQLDATAAGLSQSGSKLREMVELAVERHQADLQDAKATLSETTRLEITKLKALHLLNTERVGARLNDGDARAKAVHESLTKLNTIVLEANNKIVKNLEPGLEAQKDELSKLNTSCKDSIGGMGTRLDQVVSATQVLQSRVDALSDMTASVAESKNKMQQTFETSLKQLSAKLEETVAKINDRLEPTLESQLAEIYALKILQQDGFDRVDSRLKHCVSAADGLHESVTQVNTTLSNLNASHQEDLNKVGKRLDEHSTGLRDVNVDLAEANKKMSEALGPTLERHHLEMQAVSSRLEEMSTKISDGLEPAMKSQRDEIANLKALQQDYFENVNSRLHGDTAALERCHMEMQSVSSRLAETSTKISDSLEPAMKSQHDEISNLKALQQDYSQNVNFRLNSDAASLERYHMELQDVASCLLKTSSRIKDELEPALDSQQEDLSELKSLQQARFDEVIELKQEIDRSNSCIVETNSRLSAATGRLAQMEPAQEKQNEELSCLIARQQETNIRLNTMDERMRNACGVTEQTRDAMKSLNLRLEGVEPEQEKQREDVQQINKALEAAMQQISASRRLSEENHRKFRAMAEARERIDCKDQEAFDSLNSSLAHLSLVLKETVHRVNTHANYLTISSVRPCSERLDVSLPYRPTSQASTRREGSASSRHSDDMTRYPFKDGRPLSRPPSVRLHKEPQVLKMAVWEAPTSKETKHLSEIQRPLSTKTA